MPRPLTASLSPSRSLGAMLGWILAVLGIDRAISFSIANSVSQAGLLFATTTAIARSFSAVEQGYYYTFLSVVGLQSLFELGFGQVITQNIAHSRAKLVEAKDSEDARAESAGLVRGLLRFANIYYLWVGIVFTVLVGLGGYFFFTFNRTPAEVDWRFSWWPFVIATGATVRLTSRLSVVEGLGGIACIARMRFFINLGRGLVLLALILAGCGLNALAVAAVVHCLATWWMIEREHTRRVEALELSRISSEAGSADFKMLWHRLWPMQSRLALSYLCGFFIFAATNPILFALSGPEAAARFGITWALLQGVSGIAISWNATKAASYGDMAGRGDFDGLWKRWRKTFLQSLVVCAAGLAALALYFGVIVPRMGRAEKFLTLTEALPLMLSVLLIVCGYAMAAFVRAQLREIFAPASIVNGLCAVGFVAFAAGYLGFAWVTWAYFLSFLLSAVVSLHAFRAFLRELPPVHHVA